MKTDILTIRQYFPSEVNPTSSYWVMEQIKGIEKYGLTSIVVSPTPKLPNFIRKKLSKKYTKPSNSFKKFMGIHIIRPGYFRIPKYKFYSLTNLLLQRSILKGSKNLNPKLIHAHFGNDGVAAIPLKKKLSIPLIISFYGYDLSDQLPILLPYYKKLIKEGDLFLALSVDMQNDLLKIGFPENKIKIHHLGIQIDDLVKKSKKGKKQNEFTFLIVARFSERKGIHDSIIAFSKVILQYPTIKLRIVGDGEYRFKLVKLVLDLKLTESITFINNFNLPNPRETVLEEMANCDVFMLTSYLTPNGSKEGTPVVLMEAQAIGKPCIGTFHAGIPEVIINNETGILCKERDIGEITQAMITLLENKVLYKKYSINALEHIQKSFNNKIQMKKLYEIYRSFLEKYSKIDS